MRYRCRCEPILWGRAAGQARPLAWLVLGVGALWSSAVAGRCTSLSCDTAVNASIQTASEVDCFIFNATDGEIVDISVVSQATGSSFRPSWILLDGSGSPVAGPCGSFGPSAPNFPCGPLSASGSPYGIGVTATQPGDTGPYGIRVERLTAAQACEDIPLTCAVPVVEATDNPLDTDLFSFSVSDGEMVEISVMSGWHGGTVIDAAWQLIDGMGRAVDGACGQFGRWELYFVCGPLPASGNPYRIKVGDDNAQNDAGQYKVRFQPLTLAAECSTTALECGRALTTAIADPPPDQLCGFVVCPVLDTKMFNFSVNEGERIAVTVDTIEPTGPHFLAGWRLLDRNGNPVEGGCGDIGTSASSFVCGPLAAVGNPYQLEVGAASDLVFGNARVLVNFLTSPCATECTGDCDGSGDVVITDLLTVVNVALGNATIAACGPGDANRDGMITIEEILTAVNQALDGCNAA
jgi:hypothetical protein